MHPYLSVYAAGLLMHQPCTCEGGQASEVNVAVVVGVEARDVAR